jgi:hypothetical protein
MLTEPLADLHYGCMELVGYSSSVTEARVWSTSIFRVALPLAAGSRGNSNAFALRAEVHVGGNDVTGVRLLRP